MKRPVCWMDRDPDGVRVEIRATFVDARRLKWQFRRKGDERWNYDRKPGAPHWDFLVRKVEDRYQRRAAAWEDVLRVRKLQAEACGLPAAPSPDGPQA